jgi:hypothetical protein
MKLSKGRIGQMARALAGTLHDRGHLELIGPQQDLIHALELAIGEELAVEDRLNAEVRELMKGYQAEIERGGVDYQKMFTMIKNKLVRERGLIL